MTAKPLDAYTRGNLQLVTGYTAERKLTLPNFTTDLHQLAKPINETFEDATFPPAEPAGAWSSPSVLRYPSDQAWARTTTGPLAGSASAIRKVGQTDNQNSSLGLELYLPTHARLTFLWKVISEENFDFLWVYIDGGAVMKLSGATALAGRFWSNVLTPGNHTVDFRFTKDSSQTATGETAMIDAVEIVPETRWLDHQNYIAERDDFFWPDSTSKWRTSFLSTGTFGLDAAVDNGAVILTTAAVNNDYSALTLGSNINGDGGGLTTAREWFMEGRFRIATNTSVAAMLGMWAGPNKAEVIAIEADTSVGTTFRVRATTASATTRQDTGVTFSTGWHTFRLCATTSGLLLFIDGTCLQAGSSLKHALSSGLPTGRLRPFMAVEARSAAARTLEIDRLAFFGTR